MSNLEGKTLTGHLTPKQSIAIIKIERIAREILAKECLVDSIIDDRRKGMSLDNLAKKYFSDEYNKGKSVAIGIVGYILRDRQNEGERKTLRNKQWVNSGYSAMRNGLGIHGRDKDKMTKDAKKSIESRGLTPWGDLPDIKYFNGDNEVFTPEVAYAYNLHLDGIKPKEISTILNDVYHNGSPVRNRKSVLFKIKRFKEKYKYTNIL